MFIPSDFLFSAMRSAPLLRVLFFAQDDFALADELVVQPQAIFVRSRFASRTRRAAEQAHAGWGLKNVRGKRAAVRIKFDAQISCVGDPGDLVAFIEHDDLRDESNEYGAFGHFFLSPRCRSGAVVPDLSVHREDSIFPGKNSCELHHNPSQILLQETQFEIIHNQPVLPGILMDATCTSLRLTAFQGNRTLKSLIRGAKFRLDLLRLRKKMHSTSV